MAYLLISYICFIFAGMFNAMMDSRLDLGMGTRTFLWCNKRGQQYIDWYYSKGGNARFNPSFPSIPFLNIWFADFWHTAKHLMLYSWTFGVMFAVLSGYDWYWFLVANGLHGFSFVYFYHYYFPTALSQGNFLDYLKRVIMFWKNAHKK